MDQDNRSLNDIIDAAISQDLEELDLSHFRISELPSYIGELTWLKRLILTGCDLLWLPAEIAYLGQLEYLDLSDNHLDSFPEVIEDLRELRHIDLRHNVFGELPDQFALLPHLEVLDLSYNSLRHLSSEVGELRSLSHLYLSGNRLDTLPRELFTVRTLIDLDLSRNNLTDLSSAISELATLHRLDLTSNRLHSLPESVGKLVRLEHLGLRDNQISLLPSSLGNLSALRLLDLAENHIEYLPNSLAGLQHLTSLHLDDNQLRELPEWVGSLDRLETLSVTGNNLSQLPASLAGLEGIRQLDFDRNPWNEDLRSILKYGRDRLFVYLRSLIDAAPQYESKLMLIGEGEVGKTSLLKALQGNDFNPKEPTTHGINLEQLLLTHPNLAAKVTLNTWDFGGQEVYRVTHQFFFSKRSLYVLVWKPREGQEAGQLVDWLKRIQLRVSDARVIIVASHSRERRPVIDFENLKQRFGTMIVGDTCYEVDSQPPRLGISALRRAIAREVARLPQMGRPMSKRWIDARRQILALSATHIYRDEFDEICRSHYLGDDEIRAFTALLHDLGHIIYFSDSIGLNNLVVLKPEWLTKAIGLVLEDRETVKANGVLDHARLFEIWLDHAKEGVPRYDVTWHPYFLRLMEQFDISFRIGDHTSTKSLVGQLVPFRRPRFEISNSRKSLKLRCRLMDEAEGLIPWLIVRTHRFSKHLHWSKGMVLEQEDSVALIELVDAKTLDVSVRGSAPDHLFSILRDSVETLIRDRWPNLRYDLLVPCPHCEEVNALDAGLFNLRSLRTALAEDQRSIQCHTCFMDASVSRLLHAVEPKQELVGEMLARLLENTEEIAGVVSNTRLVTRRLLQSMSSGEIGSPRLFTFRPIDGGGIGKRRFRLALWCELPGNEHPHAGAQYDLEVPEGWVAEIAPVAVLIARLIRAKDLLGALGDSQVAVKDLKEMRKSVRFMESLNREATIGERQRPSGAQIPPPAGLTRGQGSGFRLLKALLAEVDPAGEWGGLRSFVTTEGDNLWICPRHHYHFDPGLPRLALGRDSS